MTKYIYELSDWPNFRWDNPQLTALLSVVRHRQGLLLGRMQSVGFHLQEEAVLATITEDVLKSSEIEGEILDQAKVRSSVAQRLGMDVGGIVESDREVDGVVDMTLDATRRFDEHLTADRLFAWHSSLFPGGRSGIQNIDVGGWRRDRTGPMQVVSGPIGSERVHFQAPPAEQVPHEMGIFIDWCNRGEDIDLVLKSAIAHLWFVTIHPFDDGNGRIARAISDLFLARSEASPKRFYSLSSQIRKDRKAYYDILEQTELGTLDVSDWLTWFLQCLGRAIAGAETTLENVIRKVSFWDAHSGANFNDRQRAMLHRLLGEFTGHLTTSKWAKMMKTSQDTAARDLEDLIARGIIVRIGDGRATRYELQQ